MFENREDMRFVATSMTLPKVVKITHTRYPFAIQPCLQVQFENEFIEIRSLGLD